jgi:transposase
LQGARRSYTTLRDMTIARERRVARHTVREALKDANPTTYKRKKPPVKPVTGPFIAVIEQILNDDENRPRKQRHTAKRIYERLQDEHHFTGAASTVRRVVRQLRPKIQQAFLPLEFDPGADAQVDWGEADVIMAGRQVTVRLFCLKLPASGAHFVAAYPTEKQEALFDGHASAFEHFGGVPARITYDNLTTVVKTVLHGKKRVEQETFVALRSHYLFESHFCRPGISGAHEKGAVENLVGYARRNYLVPLPEVASYDELNALLLDRCIADRQRLRPGSDRTIAILLEHEATHLRALPERRFDCCTRHPAKVNSYALVPHGLTRYSVPVEHVHKIVTLKAFVDRIEIVLGEAVIARHQRHYGQPDDRFDPLHYLPLLERRPGAIHHAKPIRRWRWPEIFDRYWAKLREHVPEGRGTKEFIAILLLLRDHASDTLEVAMDLALESRIYGHDGLKSLLLHLESPAGPPPELDLSDRQDLAQVSVGDFRNDQYNRLLSEVAS